MPRPYSKTLFVVVSLEHQDPGLGLLATKVRCSHGHQHPHQSKGMGNKVSRLQDQVSDSCAALGSLPGYSHQGATAPSV